MNNHEWIAVSDALPPLENENYNCSATVLVYIPSDEEDRMVGFYSYRFNEWCLFNDRWETDKITHWQHLPSRPNEEN